MPTDDIEQSFPGLRATSFGGLVLLTQPTIVLHGRSRTLTGGGIPPTRTVITGRAEFVGNFRS
jgi:hypothetical protein